MITKLIVLIFLHISALSGYSALIPEGLKEDFFSIYKHTALAARNVTDEPVTPDRVHFYLFTKKNIENYTEINPADTSLFSNKNAKVVFIIHGWSSNRENQWYEDLKNSFLARKDGDYYVIQVDWSDPAGQLYTVSSYSTIDVGRIVGDFLLDLHQNHSIPLENFLLIGHSLGGQVSGFAGKRVQEITHHRLPRIIALDPAGPWFSTRPSDKRLNSTDAHVVHVIHSDGGTFGYKAPIGTIDFFPNGGSGQPGCKRIDLLDIRSVAEPVTCDHERSHQYFVEAVLNPGELVAKKCGSWDEYKDGKCESGEEVAIGDLATTKTGLFFLETNRDKPYSKKSGKGGRRGPLGILSVLQH